VATVSSLLADDVTLEVWSVNRLFLRGYVPRLMTEGQVIRFLLDRGFPIPSPVVLGRIGRDYVDRVNVYIAANEIPTVRFVKGDVKEEIAREHFKRAERDGRYGVVMVGVAQEKTSAWRGWRDGGPDGHPHFHVSTPVDLSEQLLPLMRREAPCCIPGAAGRNSKEGSWVQWLTRIREVNGTIACQETSGQAQVSGAPGDPRDMAKAALPEAESPEYAKNRPPERHPKPAPRSAAAL
jgi:hypothetical protein